MGTDGFINTTNPKLGFGGTGYYVDLQSNGDLCVNNGKGANGNLACIGNSGFIGATGNITTNGNISTKSNGNTTSSIYTGLLYTNAGNY